MPVTRRAWRRCSACFGVCHWHDEAWICNDCGAEWYPEHGRKWKAPGDGEEYEPLPELPNPYERTMPLGKRGG